MDSTWICRSSSWPNAYISCVDRKNWRSWYDIRQKRYDEEEPCWRNKRYEYRYEAHTPIQTKVPVRRYLLSVDFGMTRQQPIPTTACIAIRNSIDKITMLLQQRRTSVLRYGALIFLFVGMQRHATHDSRWPHFFKGVTAIPLFLVESNKASCYDIDAIQDTIIKIYYKAPRMYGEDLVFITTKRSCSQPMTTFTNCLIILIPSYF